MTSKVARAASLLLAVGIACGKSERSGAEAGIGDAGEGASAATGANSGRGGDEGTSTGGSAGSNEAGAGSDGQTGGAPPRPDLPQEPTPGSIRCGSQMCDAASQLCCSGMAGSGVGGSGVGGSDGGSDGGSNTGTGFESCSTTFCPYRRECDEPSDCVGAEVCCFHVVTSPPSILASSCEEPEQCAFEGYWLGCGSHDDCDAAGAPECVAQDCKGETIQTCGPISRTACNF